MSDCFSMPNIQEIVSHLRFSMPHHGEDFCWEQLAADLIEQVVRENEELKRDMKKIAGCRFCKYETASPFTCIDKSCKPTPDGNSEYEWTNNVE